MTALSTIRRRCCGAMLATAIVALLAICTSGTARAQFNCGPCNGNATYQIVIDAWPVALGFASPTVDLTDIGSGTTVTYVHSGLTQGSVVNQQFNQSNPVRQYEVTDVTLNFCNGNIIYQVYCSQLEPVQCFDVVCNGNTYCIKFKFEPVSSPSGTPCWRIRIKAVSGSCPNPCTY